MKYYLSILFNLFGWGKEDWRKKLQGLCRKYLLFTMPHLLNSFGCSGPNSHSPHYHRIRMRGKQKKWQHQNLIRQRFPLRLSDHLHMAARSAGCIASSMESDPLPNSTPPVRSRWPNFMIWISRLNWRMGDLVWFLKSIRKPCHAQDWGVWRG